MVVRLLCPHQGSNLAPAESTAHLVDHLVMLGEPEWVSIKGADEPVPAMP